MKNIELYTTQLCPYCRRAKALLAHKGLEFTEFKVDGNPELKTEMIERANGGYTVPQIFIGDIHVGGCDDLFALESQNKLDALIKG